MFNRFCVIDMVLNFTKFDALSMNLIKYVINMAMISCKTRSWIDPNLETFQASVESNVGRYLVKSGCLKLFNVYQRAHRSKKFMAS